MRKHIQHIIAIIITVCIAIATFAIATAKAEDMRKYNALRAIHDNQEWIADHRSQKEECDILSDQWEQTKENNVLQVGILRGLGYEYDWSINDAVETDF